LALAEFGRYTEAELAFGKAVEMEPDNTKYLCNYGFTMAWYNGRLQEGYELLDKAVALEPSNGSNVSDRGAILFLLDRTDEAISELRRAIQLDPEYANGYYFTAMALYEAGEYEEAARYCEESLDRFPGADYMMVMLGDSQFMLGHCAEALVAYDEAITYGNYALWNIENYPAAKRALAAEKAAESSNEAAKEITVGTAEELLTALGSNRRILLKEGEYNLTAAEPGFVGSANVYFEACTDGLQLILNEVHNLTIQGAGDTGSEILIEPRYAYVMGFLNCSNVSIAGIKAGHTEGGECEGGVFSFDNSTGIQVENTSMYGCGTVGICLNESADVKVTGSTIYECTGFIMEIYNSSDILFRDCVFRNNTGGAYIDTASNLTIDSCSFLRNTDVFSMFSIWESENITVQNTEFIENDGEELVDQYGNDIEFDASNRFESNSFDGTR